MLFTAMYGDLSYARSEFNGDLEQENEVPSRDGVSLSLHYERPLGARIAKNVNWYLGLRYWDFQADTFNYSYDRVRWEAGLRYTR